MSRCKVLLDSISALKRFIVLADKSPVYVWATDDTGTRVRANSQMALMLFDLTKPLTIEIETVDEDAEKFFDSIAEFMV